MLIENEFAVASDPDAVFALMTDVEKVAPCIPGAEVVGKREDGSYDATSTVKLGPIKMTYKGTVRIAEADPEARTATLLAKGNEARGQGSAQATMKMQVVPAEGGGSTVKVSTDLAVTGRVASMGQGIMKDVAGRMIGEMARNMQTVLAGGQPDAPEAVSAAGVVGGLLKSKLRRD